MNEKHQDAFGRALLDFYEKKPDGALVIERDDGYVDCDSAKGYFHEPDKWSFWEKQALRHARGKVLDLGCGAGRHLVYLKRRGHQTQSASRLSPPQPAQGASARSSPHPGALSQSQDFLVRSAARLAGRNEGHRLRHRLESQPVVPGKAWNVRRNPHERAIDRSSASIR
jgi:SAM-dependent methyltransferase